MTALPATTHFPTALKAGLRAKEIASLTWDMVTDAEGNLGSALHLRDEASKGLSGRVIPLNKDLKAALQRLHDERSASPYVITTERSQRTSAAAIVNLFAQWYRAAGLQGCSSHSGDARSSPMPRARSPRLVALFGTFKCWRDTER